MEVIIMEPPSDLPIDEPLIVEPSDDDDDLIDRLIETNSQFRAMLAKSKASPTTPYIPEFRDP
jgi:hypothetical protein